MALSDGSTYFCAMQLSALYAIYQQHPQVTTDSRQISPGCIFFALKGPNFNGNAFALSALETGAAYCVVDEQPAQPHERLIVVPDVLTTLQELAGYHRQQFKIPFIGITGSNGKTTTKELVHAVLSAAYKTYTTRGNLNNHIGIPLTLLSVRPDAEMAIVEMGANHQREIAGYCTYTRPSHGLITNCGKAHLEGFGGIEGVRKGKGELYDFLREEKGTAFVCWDYDYLRNMSRGIEHIIKYGTDPHTTDVSGSIIPAPSFLQVAITGSSPFTIQTNLVGDYNLPNVLVAVAIGRYFHVPDATIKAAIEAYAPSNSRSQLIEKANHRIILDAYNANPSSVRLAIDNFAKMPDQRKAVCLGAMMELGEDSNMEHEQIVAQLKQSSFDEVVLVGESYLPFVGKFRYFPNSLGAAEWFQQQDWNGYTILIKGSRSMQMEKLLGDV
jgi:UDP-N-acetylmuramoyl-tripeptide--D-alanyl-D-alanine ligase